MFTETSLIQLFFRENGQDRQMDVQTDDLHNCCFNKVFLHTISNNLHAPATACELSTSSDIKMGWDYQHMKLFTQFWYLPCLRAI